MAQLRAADCRFCIADAPQGHMHLAIFCAAPAVGGPYCEAHARICRQPVELDVEALAAEIEAACEPR